MFKLSPVDGCLCCVTSTKRSDDTLNGAKDTRAFWQVRWAVQDITHQLCLLKIFNLSLVVKKHKADRNVNIPPKRQDQEGEDNKQWSGGGRENEDTRPLNSALGPWLGRD